MDDKGYRKVANKTYALQALPHESNRWKYERSTSKASHPSSCILDPMDISRNQTTPHGERRNSKICKKGNHEQLRFIELMV